MDEYLKTKEEIIKHFDTNLGLIDKAERIIAIMAGWRQGSGSNDSWAMRNHKGIDRIDIGEEKESVIATVIIPQYYTNCETDTWDIEIPIEYFNMTEEEIDKEEERYCNIRIEACKKEAERRAEEEKRTKKIRSEEKEKRERELYEQLKKKYG